MRDQLLAVEQFDSLLEAQVLVADWKEEYNTCRPHSALGMLTPVEFSEAVVDQPATAHLADGPITGARSG
jgi:transposase InsO family protein